MARYTCERVWLSDEWCILIIMDQITIYTLEGPGKGQVRARWQTILQQLMQSHTFFRTDMLLDDSIVPQCWHIWLPDPPAAGMKLVYSQSFRTFVGCLIPQSKETIIVSSSKGRFNEALDGGSLSLGKSLDEPSFSVALTPLVIKATTTSWWEHAWHSCSIDFNVDMDGGLRKLGVQNKYQRMLHPAMLVHDCQVVALTYTA